MKKNYIKTLAFYAVLIVGIIVAVSFVFGSNEEEALTYSDVVGYFKNDEVVSFTVDEKDRIITFETEAGDEVIAVAKTRSVTRVKSDGVPFVTKAITPDAVAEIPHALKTPNENNTAETAPRSANGKARVGEET